jgi:hypothetical protein
LGRNATSGAAVLGLCWSRDCEAADLLFTMTLESALLAALSAVTTALCWVVKLMYARLLKAEETVEELRQEMERLERENGQNSAKVSMFERCPKRQDCPFNALGYPTP